MTNTHIPTPNPLDRNTLASFRLQMTGDHDKLVTVTREAVSWDEHRFVVRSDGELASQYSLDKGTVRGDFARAADAMKFALDFCGWS